MTETEKTMGSMTFLSFFAGALVGAGLALLYAPKTGREIRERMGGYTDEAMSKLKEYGNMAQEKMKTFRSKAEEAAEGSASRGDEATFH